MNKSEELNEAMIENALKKGLITVNEAHIMLMVYVNKSHLNAIQSQLVSGQNIPNRQQRI